MKLILVLIFLSIHTFAAGKFNLEKIKKAIKDKGEECRSCQVYKSGENKLYLINESTMGKAASIGYLSLYLVDKNDRVLILERVKIEAEVRDHWLTDLDRDGFKEIVFVSYSSGSGEYANLFVYTVKKDSLIKRKMPSHRITGYAGHEQISVKKDNLYLSYPLYNDKDSNANPTGGFLELKFDAKKKLWKDSQGTYVKK